MKSALDSFLSSRTDIQIYLLPSFTWKRKRKQKFFGIEDKKISFSELNFLELLKLKKKLFRRCLNIEIKLCPNSCIFSAFLLWWLNFENRVLSLSPMVICTWMHLLVILSYKSRFLYSRSDSSSFDLFRPESWENQSLLG